MMDDAAFLIKQQQNASESDLNGEERPLDLLPEDKAVFRRKVAIAIVALYILLLPGTAFFALKFLQNTEMMYGAPKGSLVYETEMMSQTVFRDQVFHNPLFVLVSSKYGNESVLTAGSGELCRLTSMIANLTGVIDEFTHVVGYCMYDAVPEFANRFVSDDRLFSFIGADFLIGATLTSTQSVQDDLQDRITTAVKNNFTSLAVKFASVGLVSKDLVSGLVSNLMVIDAISIPLAMAALAYCLKSIRMLVLPGIAVPVTVCIAFSLCYPVTLLTHVSSFAPEMASATMIAITIDYSLFILSRFNELRPKYEILAGSSTPSVRFKVCFDVAVLSAHNIVVSGMTIAVALGGLILLPVKFIGTIGYVFFFSSITAVVVSLTLMPSVLFIFYDFFSVPTDFLWLWKKAKECCSKPPLADTTPARPQLLRPGMHRQSSNGMLSEEARTHRFVYSDAEGDLRGVDPFSPGTREYFDDLRTEQYTSTWFRIGSFANNNPWLVIGFVLAFGAPFMWQVTQLEVNFDLFEQVPRDSPHGAILKQIIHGIGHSSTPFYITIDTHKPGGMFSEEIFLMTQDLTRRLSEKTGQDLRRFECFAFVNGTAFDLYLGLVALADPAYKIIWNITIDPTYRAGMIQLFPTFDPFDAEANAFINKIDSVLNDFQPLPNVTLGLMGASTSSWAIMKKVLELFPLQIGITFAIIFVFIAVVFRSVLIPVRMVITVSYTVAVSLGMGVVFFQYSWSHAFWTTLHGVQSYSWTVPIFAFSLLCALALDYDVFLLTRMTEMRKHGYDVNASVVKAVWKTGRIISFAGIIMAISFGSMVFGGITMLNQFGFIASFAVILDTFVIRSLFVPAIMSLAPHAIWYPRRFERDDRDLDDMTG